MSDDILTIATPYGDVAELAQGYINRVDGERILLPLALPCQEGAGVRYVVHLADGTPAFAGAGRCVQVSDQGNTVPPDSRFETLVDSLQFDERSQPVYDYIVAIRNQAYAQQGGDAEAAAPAADEAVEVDAAEVAEGDVAVDAGDYADADEAQEYAEAGEVAVEAEPYDDAGVVAVEADEYAEAGEVAVEAEPYAEPEEYAEAEDYAADAGGYAAAPSAMETLDDPSQPAVDVYDAASDPAAMAAVAAGEAPELVPSVRPEAIPTGILERPARAVHWAPSPPRRPTPRPASGLFNYNGSGLPVPQRPPYPALDPGYFVQRAPHPAAAGVAHAADGPSTAAGYADEAAEQGYAVADSFAPEASPATAGYQEDLTVVADEGYGDEEPYAEEATVIAEEGYEQALDDEASEAEAADVDVDADDDESQGW